MCKYRENWTDERDPTWRLPLCCCERQLSDLTILASIKTPRTCRGLSCLFVCLFTVTVEPLYFLSEATEEENRGSDPLSRKLKFVVTVSSARPDRGHISPPNWAESRPSHQNFGQHEKFHPSEEPEPRSSRSPGQQVNNNNNNREL